LSFVFVCTSLIINKRSKKKKF